MRRFLKKVSLVLLLALSAPQSDAFSLAGPLAEWQTPGLGYNPLGGEITGPMNLGEEYRWTQPIITYGFDRSFLDYFGFQGVEAVDEAFRILNELPPASQMLEALPNFPLDSRRPNYRALTLNIVDIKSVALSLVLNHLGLAAPERWVWALRDRQEFTDPDFINYLVIQRNFDPVDFEPSYFVNGTRYSYRVLEFINPTFADAIEFNIADPAYFPVTSVAGVYGTLTDSSLAPGIFFSGLTRDDVGGLRYLYNPNNYNVERPPGGTQMFVPNRTNLVLVTNLDLTLLSTRSLTSTIPQITNFYPGLEISGANPIVTNIGVTPVVTLEPVVLSFFTNRSIIQVVTNTDLNAFSSFSLTSPPAALLAAFPNLSIRSTNTSASPQREIASIILTNAPPEPWGDPTQTNFILVTNYVTNLVVNYHYEFWNVLTNYSSPTTLVHREITGLDKEPWSDPLNPVYRTNVIEYFETVPSGGIIILPPGIAGYDFIPGLSATNVFASTNLLFQTNFVQNGLLRSIQDIEYRFFTNVQYAAYPIEFLPDGVFTNILVTNFVTNPIISYEFEFANVVTNYSSPTTPVVTNTYVISTNPLAPGIVLTNLVSVTPGQLPVPSGGFLIDTNLTGFEFASFPPPLVQVIKVTNIVTDFTNPLTGERTVQEVIYNFTNTIYTVFPFFLAEPTPMLRPGVDKIEFVKIEADSILGSTWLYTNRYRAVVVTNGIRRTNAFQRVQTQPDILFMAADLGTVDDDVDPIDIEFEMNMTNMAEFNYAQPQPTAQAGPGIIGPRAVISFNKLGPSIINQFPGFNTEETALFRPWVWGSFDASTNPPIVFPEDITLELLEFRELSSQ